MSNPSDDEVSEVEEELAQAITTCSSRPLRYMDLDGRAIFRTTDEHGMARYRPQASVPNAGRVVAYTPAPGFVYKPSSTSPLRGVFTAKGWTVDDCDQPPSLVPIAGTKALVRSLSTVCPSWL